MTILNESSGECTSVLDHRVQFGPLLELHRHDDAYVSFAVKQDEDFRLLVAIWSDELATRFPGFQDRLAKNSYVSINASWRLRKHGPAGKSYGYPKLSTSDLRYLCACYADLDFHRLNGLTEKEVISRISDYQAGGKIPPVSAIVRSGRGLWLLWFLHDREDRKRAQRAFPEKILQYARIQNAVVRVLTDIGADSGAKDAARHIRIPGSFNTKGEDYVRWDLCLDKDGVRPCYSLAYLETFFGVAPPKLRVRRGDTLPRKLSGPNRRKGWAPLRQRRLHDFEALCAMRGWFAEGCRNRAALIYAWLLRCNGFPREEAARRVSMLGAQCRPRLTPRECEGAIRSGYSCEMRMRDATIAEYLLITPAEMEQLLELREARKKEANVEPPLTRAQTRRDAIRAIIDELGKVPSGRAMTSILRERGYRIGHSQVAIDYRALSGSLGAKKDPPSSLYLKPETGQSLPVAHLRRDHLEDEE